MTFREPEYGATVLRDGIVALLDRLDGPLGVVTNGLPVRQCGKLARVGLGDRFDAIVAAYEAGAYKPDRAPFARPMERLPADSYVMVDDDHRTDVADARSDGWTAAHLDDDHAADATVAGTDVPRALQDL